MGVKQLIAPILLLLAACVPVPLGSVITGPLEVSPSQPLQVSPGKRWYVAIEYDQQRWRGRALRLASGEITGRNFERVGTPIYPAFGPAIRDDFGTVDPFSRCSFRGNRIARSANHFSARTTTAPPAWQAGLVASDLVLRCDEADNFAFLSINVANQAQRVLSLEFTTLYRLIYAFDVPAGTPAGQYRLVLEVRDVETTTTISEQLQIAVVPAL